MSMAMSMSMSMVMAMAIDSSVISILLLSCSTIIGTPEFFHNILY